MICHTRVLGRAGRLGTRHDRAQFVEGRDLVAEVIERGRAERGLAREQVHELAEGARVHDERVAVLAGVVAFAPAEHVAVEREQLGASCLVEQRADPS